MPIARNTSTDMGLDTGGTNPYLGSHTTGSGANRMLASGFFSTATDGTATVKYNGVTQTVVDTDYDLADRGIYACFLLNPASGANVYRVDWVSGPDHVQAMAADYTGVVQTAPVGTAHNQATSTGTTSLACTITVATANSWVFAVLREDVAGTVTWTNATELKTSNGLHIADSNGPVAAGSYTVTAAMASADARKLIVFAFAPDTGAVVFTPPAPLVVGQAVKRANTF